MLTYCSLLILAVSGVFFSFHRIRRYLHLFQQEQYIRARFITWVLERRAFDRRGSLAAVVCAVALVLFPAGALLWCLAFLIAVMLLARWEGDPQEDAKVPLKMTNRARRIAYCALLISLIEAGVLLAVALASFSQGAPSILSLLQVLLFQSTWLLVLLADVILEPLESRIQRTYLDEAKQCLRRLRPKPVVIGITGSYGKTTTKAILARFISGSLGPAFFPEKGVNSLMGITRELRLGLKPHHRYAVIEMGAFERGSIRRLCELTPPDAAIITAVGEMHLDRFGSSENIFLAKSELAQAVPESGFLAANGDNAGARLIAEKNPKAKTLLYGMESPASGLYCSADDLKYSAAGTSFRLTVAGNSYQAFTPLLGRTAVSNILAAVTMASALGADAELLVAAMRRLPPVDNRLEFRKAGERSFLYDAYNSNPRGFAAALEVLAALEAKRRILVTPGMIELGEIQPEENEKAAFAAAAVCDRVLVVSETNREALFLGLTRGGFDMSKASVHANRTEALRALEELAQPGDLVLLENDLPDLYEPMASF